MDDEDDVQSANAEKAAFAIPKEYADLSKTPLRVHVPHEGLVNLELKKGGSR